jgi:hypothetical protein
VVKDAWNNPTSPVQAFSDEGWIVQLTDGPLRFFEKTENISVDDSGQITFFSSLRELEHVVVVSQLEQVLLLKTLNSQRTLLETSIPLKVCPSQLPSKLQVLHCAKVSWQ